MLKRFQPAGEPELQSEEPLHPSGIPAARFFMSQVKILDPGLCRELIEQRQKRGIDKYDEVWNGIYIVNPLANNPHQGLVLALCTIFSDVVVPPKGGQVLPGANVSDRRAGWEHNFRDPDVVVVLKNGRAIDCISHWLGGPDFLVEVQSPGDQTDEKIPFYSQIRVQELLIVHRDLRHLRLLRHDGQSLVEVGRSDEKNKDWLTSKVLPLAFRWLETKEGPRTQIKRTDRKRKTWTV